MSDNGGRTDCFRRTRQTNGQRTEGVANRGGQEGEEMVGSLIWLLQIKIIAFFVNLILLRFLFPYLYCTK